MLQAGCPSCHPTNSVKALKADTTETINTTINTAYFPCHESLMTYRQRLSERIFISRTTVPLRIITLDPYNQKMFTIHTYTQVSRCQKKSSGLYGAREDNRGRHNDHPAGPHSIRTNQQPTSIIPPFSCRIPFLPQPSTLSWLGTGNKYAGLHTQWHVNY